MVATTTSADARERILRAAERLFGEKGYAATSVQEITEAAEVNKALLYYYFEDKRSLYVSLIDNGLAEFRQMVQEALGTPGSYAERLRTFVAGHIRLLWTRQEVVRVVYRCLMAGEGNELGLTERFIEGLQPVIDFLAAGIAAREFRDVNPEMAALSLLAMGDKFACGHIFHGRDFDPEVVAAHVADLFLKGIQARS